MQTGQKSERRVRTATPSKADVSSLSSFLPLTPDISHKLQRPILNQERGRARQEYFLLFHGYRCTYFLTEVSPQSTVRKIDFIL